MPGIRQKKKEALRSQILEAAKECFLTDGFDETSIADIAARANIGVGTLYNYFPSKALLFIESYFRDLGNPKEKLVDAIQKYGEDPALTISHITEVYLEPYKTFDKTTIRELFAVFMDSLSKNSDLAIVYMSYDYLYIDFLTKILEAYKEKGIIGSDLDSKDGAFCIYSIILAQSLLYMFEDRLSYETIKDNIFRQIKLFFSGKVKKKGATK